ncbi:hypothetical protein [Gemmiger sp.]
MAQQKIWFDFVNNTIMVEANYLPQTRKVGSKAYKTLLAAKRDNPTATIETFGKREDKYNHITVSQMQTYFEVNGLTAGAEKLKEMRENKETHINKNGRAVRTYNMGKIRQWFMENYSVGYKKYEESKDAASNEVENPVNGNDVASNAVQMPTSSVEKEEKPAA